MQRDVRHVVAQLSTEVLASPESKLNNLKTLLEICEGSSDPEVQSVSLLSLSAVYADILPGYRIKIISDSNTSTAISKDVQKLRDYESGLLKNYERYVSLLTTWTRVRRFRPVCIRCMCVLLSAVPHFNLTEKLLSAVVPRMDSDVESIRSECLTAIESIFTEESKHDGEATLTAVEFIADYVRQKQCTAKPEVILVFEKLHFDAEFVNSLTESSNHKGSLPHGSNLTVKGATGASASHTLTSKREKKAIKRKLASKVKRDVEADFKAAESKANTAERKRRQSSTLSAVFETYFRVLKASIHSQTKAHRQSDSVPDFESSPSLRPLLLPTLQGLSKFSHLISVDFMKDLLGALESLAGKGSEISQQSSSPASESVLPPPETGLTVTERLACISTAFAIMRSNLDAIAVDLNVFHSKFLLLLNSVPLAEQREMQEENGFGLQWARCLSLLLWEGRMLDLNRCAGYIQRLAQTAGLHSLSGTAMAALTVIARLLQRHSKCRNMLHNEGREATPTAMIYSQELVEDGISQAALNSVLWELTLLSKHFHPHVAQLAQLTARLAEDPSKVSTLMVDPVQTWERYRMDRGGFYPAVKKPSLQPSLTGTRGAKGKKRKVEVREGGNDEENDDGVEVGLTELFHGLSQRRENLRLKEVWGRVKTAVEVMKKYREDGPGKVKKAKRAKKGKEGKSKVKMKAGPFPSSE